MGDINDQIACVQEPPALLTPRQAARELQISTNYVHALLKCGALPGIRVGRQWRVPREEFEAILASGKGIGGPAQ